MGQRRANHDANRGHQQHCRAAASAASDAVLVRPEGESDEDHLQALEEDTP
jgi:hypothetical protein